MKEIVNIENPCSVEWSKMTPDKAGRFCNSCEKIVIDFSNKTLEEIKIYLSKYDGKKVCGRFQERHTTKSNKWFNFLNNIELVFF